MSMGIYLTGDTHRGNELNRLKKVPKDCEKLIVCGDFGVPFQVSSDGIWSTYDKYLGDVYKKLPYEVIFVDGNHENFDYLDRLEVDKRFSGEVNKVSENITRLRRGELYEIGGKTIWTFGGATSIDANMRIEGRDWWSSEVASYAEMEHGLKLLEQVDYKVDYIITHTPPERIIEEMGVTSIHCPVALYLDEVMNKVQYRQWYCGHMHEDQYIDKYKLRLLFRDIVKIS